MNQRKRKEMWSIFWDFSPPLVDDCELYDLLHSAGIKTIHEISRCRDLKNIRRWRRRIQSGLHQESRYAAEDFNDRLKIPFIELRRLYQTDKIQNQYQALASVLGISFELDEYREAAEQGIEDFRKVCPDASFAVGECMNGDPFELALALLKYGFKVPEIYGTITIENFVYMKHIAELSPDTKVFSNMEPMTSLLPIKTELSVSGTKSEILKDTYVVTAQYLSCVIRLVQMPIVCLGTHMGICG